MPNQIYTKKQKIFSGIFFIISIGFSFGILFININPQKWKEFGYLGVFMITLVGASSLFIPGPTLITTFIIGSMLNPFFVAIIAGLGSAFGEITGYFAGFFSKSVFPEMNHQSKWFLRISKWIVKYPFVTIFIVSAIPNFFTDISGLIAGRQSYSILKYFLATFLGKIIRFGLASYFGSFLINRFTNLL